MNAATRPMSTITETVGMGTENHDFGVKDAKGRAVGAGVYFTTQTMEAVKGEPTGAFHYVEAGTYLTAWGFATRAGERFGAITGAYARFRITDTADGEARAMAARDAWVAEYLRNAKKRAEKNFPA